MLDPGYDLCPITGRGRLSYERSAYLFKHTSLKVSTTGWTLHQLRHSALTHLAEAGVNLPLLMAKSGHQNLRSLQRYARPGAERASQTVGGSRCEGLFVDGRHESWVPAPEGASEVLVEDLGADLEQ